MRYTYIRLRFVINLHYYGIFAQIAEKMSKFGAVDVKQYTPKRVLVAVANHGRLVICTLSNFFIIIFLIFYIIYLNNGKSHYYTNFECMRNRRQLYSYIY